MKKTVIWLAVILIVVCGGGGLVYVQGQKAVKELALKAELAKQVVVRKGDILVQVIDTGIIDAGTSVEVKCRISGKLEKLLVGEGDWVAKGSLIVVIDPVEYGFQNRQSRAQVAGAKSNLGRASVELNQRRKTAQAALDRAKSAVASLEKEMLAQPKLTQSAIQSSESALAQAKSALSQLESSTQATERVAAQSSVDEARSARENAKRELERRTLLVNKGYIAESEVDLARQTFEIADARLRVAEDKLLRIGEQQRFELEQARERVRQAQSDYDRARANSVQDVVKREQYRSALANLRDAQAGLRDVDALRFGQAQSRANVDQLSAGLAHSTWQIEQTRVHAPLTGTVTRKYVQEGELVTGLSNFSTGTPIVRIEDRKSMLVKLNVNEIDVAKLAQGMKADIVIDALPNKTFTGVIQKIAPTSMSLQSGIAGQTQATTEAVVKFQVEVTLQNPSPEIRSGMNAKCTVNVIKKINVLVLPLEFVGKDDEGNFVELASNAKGTKTRVKTGQSSGALIEIISGVNEGAKLRRPAFNGPTRKGMMSTGPDS